MILMIVATHLAYSAWIIGIAYHADTNSELNGAALMIWPISILVRRQRVSLPRAIVRRR
jgi:ADP-ribosylglycohydrolase